VVGLRKNEQPVICLFMDVVKIFKSILPPRRQDAKDAKRAKGQILGVKSLILLPFLAAA